MGNKEIWLILLALLGSAFFSGTETALISVNKIKMHNWLDKETRLAWLANRFLNRPGDLLSTLLVGNNLMNIIATVLISDLIFRWFPDMEALSILVSAILIPVVVIPPILFFGEIIPKSLAREHASRLLPFLSAPLQACHYLLIPVAKSVRLLSSLLLLLFGIKKSDEESLFTRKNIQRVLMESEKAGVLEAEERDYISGVFDFSETIVREVMTPRTAIIAVQKGASIEEIAARMNESNYSRIPVYEESLDQIIGFVHVMDLLSRGKEGEPEVHPVLFTPETRKCDNLFYEMRQKKIHLAVVLDEYGGTAGIVTLEDLLEELVGDIHDVHDARRGLVKIGLDRSIIVDGRTRFEELEGKINLPKTEYEVETIGGLIVSELGRIPEQGERFQFGPLRITVLESTPKRIERLELKQMEPLGEGGEDEDGEIRSIGR